jgi:pyruvate dehydrogenase E2 component (dihydrolipoamide acetyltransferase)
MATKVHMEALSPTMEEGQLVKWLKKEGDPVSKGEVLAEIETDKATMELVARRDGILREILLPEGGVAPVGHVIALIAAEGEEVSEPVSDVGEEVAGTLTPPADAEMESEGPERLVTVVGEDSVVASETGAPVSGDGRVKASPLARRMAAQAGLALVEVQGSGPGGRVVKRDVEGALEDRAEAVSPSPTGFAGAPAPEGPDFEDVALTQLRKTIARRLAESIGPVPHYFLTVHVNMERTLEARERINQVLEAHGGKVSVNDMIVRATAAALRLHPAVNSAWMGEFIRRHNRVHIGVAVAVEDGLITPVVRDADRKGVAEIAAVVKELAARAREKRLMPEEYTGSTFTVSNLGMFDIEEFTGVINPPEAGLLAVGAVEAQPVVEGNQVVIQRRMRMTMSCDHRVIDGATGSHFLATLKAMLEEPGVALL